MIPYTDRLEAPEFHADMLEVLIQAPPGMLPSDRMAALWKDRLEALRQALALQVWTDNDGAGDSIPGVTDMLRRLEEGLDPMQLGDLAEDWLKKYRGRGAAASIGSTRR